MNMDNIINAIIEYREKNGIQWKRKLRELYWSGLNTNSELQAFRNQYYKHLDKIKYHTTAYEIREIFNKG